MMNLLVFPAVIGFMVFAEPIVALLFGRGAFTAEDVVLVGGALFMYAPSLIGLAYREVLARMFYSLHDTRTPTINAVVTVILNVIFSITLSRFIGLNGLALGTSLAGIIGAVIMFAMLRVQMNGLKLTRILPNSTKILFSSIVMGVVSYVTFLIAGNYVGSTLQLLVAILVAMLTYGALILLFRVEEASHLLKRLTKK